MSDAQAPGAAAAGRIRLGSLEVTRLGYGAMSLSGPDAWGPPPDEPEGLRALRRAVELGVDFVDTADSYGPAISEQLVRKALHPYPDGLVIATKAGQARPDPTAWVPLGRREYIRQQCHLSLRNLGLERIDLFQIHRPDPHVPLADQLETLRELQDEGLIRHVGLSNVTLEQVQEAREAIELVSVQLPYSLARREHEPTLERCEAWGIAFIPWAPMAAGRLVREGALDALAAEFGASPAQLALAWLLRRSPVLLPIPGSAKVAHVEQNYAAAAIALSDEQATRIEQALGSGA